jgi:hypothetical protein
MPTTACRRRSGLNYVSRRDVLEHLLLQREIGHKATQPSVLALQLLQAFGVLKLQAPILPAPAIITLLGDAGLLTGKRQALSWGELHLNLTQHGDDLLGAEPLPSGHLRLLSFQVNPPNQPGPKRASQVTPAGRRRILKHIGNALLVQHRVSGRVAVEEKPDVRWDRPDLGRLYARLEDEYELKERADALNRKLAVVAETAKVLTDLIDTERSIRLEVIIVLLIVSEIVITFYQMWMGRAH